MTNKERLQEELGDQFQVLDWTTSNGNAGSDEVLIARKADLRHQIFYVDDLLVSNGHFVGALSANIKDTFAKMDVVSKRRGAFEHIVKSRKLPLPLERLSNDTRYESWETEWAYRFYGEGLNACVGHPIP